MPDLAPDVDPAAVVAHDAVGHREPEPGPLAHVLGREERLEDVRQVLWRDARAFVLDADGDPVARRGRRGRRAARRAARDERSRRPSPPPADRLDRVHDEVREHLLDLPASTFAGAGAVVASSTSCDASRSASGWSSSSVAPTRPTMSRSSVRGPRRRANSRSCRMMRSSSAPSRR